MLQDEKDAKDAKEAKEPEIKLLIGKDIAGPTGGLLEPLLRVIKTIVGKILMQRVEGKLAGPSVRVQLRRHP